MDVTDNTDFLPYLNWNIYLWDGCLLGKEIYDFDPIWVGQKEPIRIAHYVKYIGLHVELSRS